ncbi:MAG: pyridoxamine 5'-phosphate oxidase family protein [Microlunatus sp.]|nr:pyridoxamine 5'-phosphate oxidase family protein [Microlunatus sp.]
MTEPLPGSIRTLTEEECWELVDAASVGRLGFVADGDVKIIPVNYLVDVDVIIRTLPEGIVARLSGTRVTFEVDYHSPEGVGWSVLMHGPLQPLPADEADLVNRWNRVLPWAGGDRSLFLSFIADTIDGRRVSRHRN